MLWTTFEGRAVLISELTHQHLSNILWYFEIAVKDKPTLEIAIELNKRFNGVRLPYRPCNRFTEEIEFLYQNRFIKNKFDSDIIINGKTVGRVDFFNN